MKIQEFIDSISLAKDDGRTDKYLEDMVFTYVSQDETVIPALLSILSHEREEKKRLLIEINSELSMSLATLEHFTADKNHIEATKFNIKLFYKKWENKLLCNFKIPGLK